MRAFNDKLFGAGTPTDAEIKAANERNADTNTITDADETNLATLTDNSMADALHRHSELSASDGTPDGSFSLDATGLATLLAASASLALKPSGNSETTKISVYRTTGGGSLGESGVMRAVADGVEIGTVDAGLSPTLYFITPNNDSGTAIVFKPRGTERLRITPAGHLIATTATYADNAAAVSGGLAVGTIYKTAAGELRIVV
jgi:hypothetical protein